jgi:hypothetical protein
MAPTYVIEVPLGRIGGIQCRLAVDHAARDGGELSCGQGSGFWASVTALRHAKRAIERIMLQRARESAKMLSFR